MLPAAFGLSLEWDRLKKISLRQAVRNVSLSGGQGRLKCSCKVATCQTNRCACFKAKRKCNSRCHPANARCRNHDHDDFGDDSDNIGDPIEEQNPDEELANSEDGEEEEEEEEEEDEEEEHDQDADV